ncbi:MAG TPA: hypothetical protein DCY13_23350 [Verrucomicrobiales bacterium]|nr:hypothetical protein [Verrucomicrobiales bacterium]
MGPLTVFAIWRLGVERDIARLEQRARDAGEPITLAELSAALEPVPNEENVAVALWQIWEDEDPEHWKTLRSGRAPFLERKRFQLPPEILESRASGRDGPAELPWSDAQAKAVETWAQSHATRMEMVAAALQLPQCRFRVQIDLDYNAFLPHLAALRDEADAINLLALLALHKREHATATLHLEQLIRLSELTAKDLTLLGKLLSSNLKQQAIHIAVHLLATEEFPPESLPQLDALMRRVHSDGEFRNAMITERALAGSAFSLSLGEIARLVSDPGRYRAGGFLNQLRLDEFPLGWTGYFAVDKRLLLQTFEEALAAAEDGTAESALLAGQILNARADQAKASFQLLTAILVPGSSKAAEKLARVEARRRCVLAAIAIESLARNLGSRSLDHGAVEAILAETKDPFGDQPLKLFISANAYVIYAAGPDRQDDGGILELGAGQESGVDVGIKVAHPLPFPDEPSNR